MKFVVSTTALTRALQITSGALTAHPVMPVLEDFLFELEGGKLSISTSNLEVSINTSLEVNGTEDGRIAIPGKILLDSLKMLPEQPVSFNIDTESRGIEITAASGKYRLVGEKAEDFPVLERPGSEDSITLRSDQLVQGVEKTSFAVSNDEMRQNMRGINMNIDFNQLTFAATDPTGGAGIQADILTLSSMGCHALSVVTAVTVQDTIMVSPNSCGSWNSQLAAGS